MLWSIGKQCRSGSPLFAYVICYYIFISTTQQPLKRKRTGVIDLVGLNGLNSEVPHSQVTENQYFLAILRKNLVGLNGLNSEVPHSQVTENQYFLAILRKTIEAYLNEFNF